MVVEVVALLWYSLSFFITVIADFRHCTLISSFGGKLTCRRKINAINTKTRRLFSALIIYCLDFVFFSFSLQTIRGVAVQCPQMKPRSQWSGLCWKRVEGSARFFWDCSCCFSVETQTQNFRWQIQNVHWKYLQQGVLSFSCLTFTITDVLSLVLWLAPGNYSWRQQLGWAWIRLSFSC